jgi:preprotein translocase subunit YajC
MFNSILLFSNNAFAQAAQSGVQQQNPFMSFVPLVMVFGIFYFLMIRPQKKKLEEEQAMLKTINKGDEIYTKSGMIGTIAGLTDKVVTLEISEGVKIKLLRGQIGGLADKIFAEKKAD